MTTPTCLIGYLALAFCCIGGWLTKRMDTFNVQYRRTLPAVLGFEVLLAFVCYLWMILFFTPAAVNWFLSFFSNSSFSHLLLISAATQFLMLAAAALLLALIWTFRAERRKDWPRALAHSMSWKAWAALLLLAFSGVIAIGNIIGCVIEHISPGPQPDQVAVEMLKERIEDPAIFFILSCTVIFAVPVGEELLFRGFLYTWMRRYLSLPLASVISSVIFALFHLNDAQGWTNLALFPALMWLSILLSLIRERDGSLWRPIFMHCAFNLFNTLLILFSAESTSVSLES